MGVRLNRSVTYSKRTEWMSNQARLTVVGGAGGLQAAAADLLSAQTNLLFELLDLTVAVPVLLCLLRHQLTLH